jgi:PIN domain nuclease of toxin-antitoxin system
MRLLLDTHVLLWAMLDDPQLGAHGRTLIKDPHNEVWVSAVSYCEIAIKSSLGKSGLSCSTKTMSQYVSDCGIPVLDLRAHHAETLETLPWHHRDPFDRMLVAQALSEPMRLVTHDHQVIQYSDTIIEI